MSHQPFTTIIMIWVLLAYPAILLSCGRNAWRGLRGRTTITHFGLRAGWIARVYGLLYLLVLLGLAVFIPQLWQYLRSLTLNELTDAFRFSLEAPPWASLFFALLGLAFYSLTAWGSRYRQERDPDWATRMKRPAWYRASLYAIPTLTVLIGVVFALGIPIVIVFGLLLGFTYIGLVAEEGQLLDESTVGPA